MNQRRTVMITMGLVLALILGYEFGGMQKMGAGVSTIESYQVPPERSQEIYEALRRMFPSNPTTIADGYVEVVGGNTIVVRTTKEMQAGIRQFVREYASQKQPLTPIRLEYWLIGAKPGTSGDKNFGELVSVVDSLKKAQGDQHFEILDHSDISTLSNERARSQSSDRSTELEARPVFANEKITAELKIDGRYGKFESNVRLAPGQFIVLGQNSFRDNKMFGPGHEDNNMNVYHVVRASVIR